MNKIILLLRKVPPLFYLLKWALLVLPIAALVGTSVALFLWLLDKVTALRFQQPWLLYLLPFAGVAIYFLYKFLGKNSEAGNNLIIDEIHQPGGGVPLRMAPLVLLATIITHLFGGSAGREGTAVQIGGSISARLGKWLGLDTEDTRTVLMVGIAAGFGAVFGTPLAGSIFALEVLFIGRFSHRALWPCLMAAILADVACKAWGIEHTLYNIVSTDTILSTFSFLSFDLVLLVKVLLAGICFGLAAFLFSELVPTFKNLFHRFISIKWFIPALGGLIIILLTFSLGTSDYLGLGVSNPNPDSISILSCFKEGGATYFSWFWKLLFTAVTLGAGFKGGEVTPLFFVGAALGNTIAVVCGAPVDFMAALGFLAVFAGATNTPIACTIMGIELFGGEYVLYYAIACFTAYYFSGHSGIYSSQRILSSKLNAANDDALQTLKTMRDARLERWWGRWKKK